MKIKKYVSIIASMLVYLIISLPIVFAQEINYVLDANGNLVTGDSFYREYNELNQLIRIREGNISTGKVLEEYVWHPVEERILIKDVYYNNTKNYTVYYVNKEYVVIENQTGNYTEEYIYQDNVLVAQVDTNGNKIAVHPDHEGSSTTLTDAQGNVLETTFYSAYGEILSGGKTSRYDYEGKEYDSVVEDYDFNFRKYKPEIPIFTQPDTLIQNVYDPQLLNRYSFERNNPQKNIDPNGHCGPYTYYCSLALLAIVNYIRVTVANPQITIPRVMNAINNAKKIPDKTEIYLHNREVAKVLAVSDSLAQTIERTGDPPKRIMK